MKESASGTDGERERDGERRTNIARIFSPRARADEWADAERVLPWGRHSNFIGDFFSFFLLIVWYCRKTESSGSGN